MLATIRSRADEIYLAGYRLDMNGPVEIIPESVATATQREMPAGVDRTWRVVGDGVAHFDQQSLAAAGCATDETLLPSAAGVLTLGLRAFERGDVVDAAQALPVYLQGTRPWRKSSPTEK